MARATRASAGARNSLPVSGNSRPTSRTRSGTGAQFLASPSPEFVKFEDTYEGLSTVPTGHRTLQSVTIMKPTTAKGKGKGKASTNSSVDSTSTSSSDADAAYATPATSIAVTPEASVKGKSITRKRTRLSNEVKVDSTSFEYDEALAQALQMKEYGEESRPSKRQRVKQEVEDSEDLSDAISEDALGLGESASDSDDTVRSRDQALAKARAGKKAVAPTPYKPTRNASRVARSSLNKSNSRRVQIADSDSELSAIVAFDSSEEASFIVSESEAEEDEIPESSEDDIPLAKAARQQSSLGTATTATDVAPPRSAKRGAAQYRRRSRQRLAEIDDDEDEISPQRLTRKERERKKLEKAHPQIKSMWTDLEKIPVIKPVQAPQPQSINRTLKSFQREGLDWMVKQEKTQYKGGLLGDEMGMGKTIQAVSLIMSDYPVKQPTLVVVPPVALMQWSSEIGEYTDGKLNVLVYHGQNTKTKGMKVKDLEKYDVIMISYNSLESVFRKEVKGWSRGEDIVKEASPIHAITFHRIILDEAHSIKSRTTGVAKACFALKGKYKWCLSGTPVQNRIGEFFSLLRFLEVRPFADYFCKKCPCSMLHWDVDKDYRCVNCKHSSIEHVSVFNQELLNPLTQSEEMKDRSAAMDKLHMITARIMLRRMKRDHVSSMELPPKEVIIHNEFFGEIERDFSSSIMSNTARTFDTYVSRGVMLNNYANIFGLIMQMRQVANHPDLLLKKHAHEGQNVLVCNICDEPAEEAIRSKCKHEFCRSCVKSYVRSVEDNGGEADCPRCHIPLSIDFDQPEIEQDEEAVKKSSIVNRIRMENWTSSTKIEMLVYDLWKLRSKKQTLKSIIFSQFTSMLQLVEWRLRRAGFNTVMLDGSMTPIQRQRSIDHFMNTPECEIFLVSLKAGGVALNLTEASRVFIIDPWWNPAAEWQSADRCHRIGQKRPCVITRLCIEDSVESRIVMLQEKKANMISGTINNDKVAMEKLTPEDMQFLFRGS
ncbi:ATP-dependent helicase rhp16 [Sphaceloma murrayae]|uniref:ATP-dependent helicase rhp16 n=1 Tax=Sphaceloma murrayae TaxID=2082308 RepID=A0A2K1QL91_9PEZI|nr:ATP-dependent helicase rhp16 [Sphaceloma murrayae]